MRINDPVLRLLNNVILQLKYIDWEKFWTPLERRWHNDPDFAGYIPPSRNIGVLFLKIFHQMVPKDTATMQEMSPGSPIHSAAEIFMQTVVRGAVASVPGMMLLSPTTSLAAALVYPVGGMPTVLQGVSAILNYVSDWHGQQFVPVQGLFDDLAWNPSNPIRCKSTNNLHSKSERIREAA